MQHIAGTTHDEQAITGLEARCDIDGYACQPIAIIEDGHPWRYAREYLVHGDQCTSRRVR